jgi:hypothetical protein
MDSEKIIIELKELSKVYQMVKENIVKALGHINNRSLYSQYSHILIKSSSRSYTIFSRR